jgi:TM2 domain-containing membrane protein YozV
MHHKSPGVAAVLSAVWCGLGQIYNGNIGKGVLMMMVYPFCFAISAIGWVTFIAGAATAAPGSGSMLLLGMIAIAAAPALWIGGMVGAYRTAERINESGNFI